MANDGDTNGSSRKSPRRSNETLLLTASWYAAGGRRAGARRTYGPILFDALQQNAVALG